MAAPPAGDPTLRKHCPRCWTVVLPGERRCVACGKRLRGGRLGSLTWLVLVGLLVGGVVVATRSLWEAADEQGRLEVVRDAQPRPRKPRATTTTSTTMPPITTTIAMPTFVRAAAVTATNTAKETRNTCGDRLSFEPEHVQDSDLTTAWRVKGNGVGESITLALPWPIRLKQAGLLPGYAAVDACSGTDRFTQQRRVTKVRWEFDGGVVIEQEFEDVPQLQTIPVDVITSTVRVTILATTKKAPTDFTAISEIQLLGLASAA